MSTTSSDSNIYLATADSNHYLQNPIDWNNTTSHGVKDNSIPGSKIISIPVDKIVGGLPGGDDKANIDAGNLSSSNIVSWQSRLGIDSLNTTLANKANKATTLAGYTISDAYTKAEVDAKVESAQTGLKFYKETGDIGAADSTATIEASKITLYGKNIQINATNDAIIPYISGVNSISSDGSIPLLWHVDTLKISDYSKQILGNINVNGHVNFSNKYYDELTEDINYKQNINGALGWYVWKHDYVDSEGNIISLDSNITITNVKLRYTPGRVLIGNNIAVKLSDWLTFRNAFGNKSVVTNAVRTTANNTSSYTVKYYRLSSPLKVVKVNNVYQTTYNGYIYTVTQVANHNFKATSVTDPSNEINCISQVTTLADIVDDQFFTAIVLNPNTTDGTYTVNFSLPTVDDNFSTGSTNITSNNGKQINAANFIPTLNWNVTTPIKSINRCKLYLSNKKATITQFKNNTLPTQDIGNLFTNLNAYKGELGAFSYTQKSRFTNNLIHISHEYSGGYNTMILEYQKVPYGDSPNTDIFALFTGDYEYNGKTRTWDTSLRVTDDPTLGCVQIYNFSYAEGYELVAAGAAAHAEGKGCSAYEDFSHVEGSNNLNYGYGGHVEGWNNVNYGFGSHVEGFENICNSNASHVEGRNNIVSSENQHVCGRYNIEDTAGEYAFIIGNGSLPTSRSNALTVDWDGNVAINNSLNTKSITCSTIQNDNKLTLYSPHSIDLSSDTGSVNITGNLALDPGTQITWTRNGSYIKPTKFAAVESFELEAQLSLNLTARIGEINLSALNVNFTGDANFLGDKQINFYTNKGSTTTTSTRYSTTAKFYNNDGGHVEISSSQVKLWSEATSEYLTLEPTSIDIKDSNYTHTTITPGLIRVGQNNWASTLGYGILDISGDGIDDVLNYDSISTTHSSIHRIKLPKGNIEDGTSFVIWVGTQAQYTALTAKDASTMYFIVGTDGTVTTKFGV